MLYWLAAVVIVGAGCLAASAAGSAVFLWAARAVRRAPAVAALGLALTAAATINVLVPRTCESPDPAGSPSGVPSQDGAERNRPLISAVAGDGRCRRLGLGQVGMVVLLGVGTSLAVHVAELRPRRAPLAAARH